MFNFAIYMKKYFTGLLFLFILIFHGQTFNGTIYLRDNSALYLNQIYVTNLNTQKTFLADYQGEFNIPAKVGDVIRFTSIVTERKDITLTPQYFQDKRMLVELSIAYHEIKEVVLRRFKPTGNFKVDVLSTREDKRLALANKIGLPSPKGDGTSPRSPVASFNNGGLGFNVQSVFDILTGERRKQERLYAYEAMQKNVTNLHNYYGDDYFIKLKIPKNLIDNFLQFVYTSDDLGPLVKSGDYAIIEMSIEKYLPVYLKRLRNSNLQAVIGDK
ncbi:hypothetical protein HZQ24_00105 [Elizabethkingia anophelis]|nr:hypothetical protein [Elizabethkingia anophelis]